MATTLRTPSLSRSSPSSSFPLRAYFGHHKCASGWTVGMMREFCLHMAVHFKVVNRRSDFASAPSLGDFVADQGIDFLAYANADIKAVRSLPLHRGFHVVRDPRDIVVSAYFSHKKSHHTDDWPELIDHRARLQRLSVSEGLLLELDFIRPFFEHMLTWDYEQENVLELRMEDMTANPLPSFLEIMEFLELIDVPASSRVSRLAHRIVTTSNRLNHRGRRFMPGQLPLFPTPTYQLHSLSSSTVERIVQDRTFERLTGRKRGQEKTSNHLRKGVPGDWKNHFEDTHIQAFKKKYNDLLLKLDYEDTPDWSLSS